MTRQTVSEKFRSLPLIYGAGLDQIAEFCRSLGQPAWRAKQIWHWLYHIFVSDWSEMSDLPASMRESLRENWSLNAGSVAESVSDSPGGGATKLLVALRDSEMIEEVMLYSRGRTTACISSQVGCSFNCAFCASGKGGFKRNLEIGEMVFQVIAASRITGARPANLVFMGIGEPFDNYDAVLESIRIMNHPDGLSLGARHITISTCGLIPGIERLQGEGLQVELSVSLHAPDDDLRSLLMPVNRTWGLERLMKVCGEYSKRSGRLITFEYTLIEGVNDSPSQALELARLIRSAGGRVNLIPLSEVPEFEGRASTESAARAFMDILKRARINTTMRASKGGRVRAACGQLRRGRLVKEHKKIEQSG